MTRNYFYVFLIFTNLFYFNYLFLDEKKEVLKNSAAALWTNFGIATALGLYSGYSIKKIINYSKFPLETKKKNYEKLTKELEEKKTELFQDSIWNNQDFGIAEKRAQIRQYVQFFWNTFKHIPSSFIPADAVNFQHTENKKNQILEDIGSNNATTWTSQAYLNIIRHIIQHDDKIPQDINLNYPLRVIISTVSGFASLLLFLATYIQRNSK